VRSAGSDCKERCQDRVTAENGPAAEVTRLCGYLPLAVRIIAARLVGRPAMSIAEFASRLADEQHRLGELEAGDRQVRASFGISYEGLDPGTARMFRLIGLIPGPDFTAGVAATLTDTTPREAEVLLEALIDAHLVEAVPSTGRYRLHDLLRLYGRERVQAEETDRERDEALRRVLEWYVNVARAADRVLIPGRHGLLSDSPSGPPKRVFATPLEALTWFEAERVNLLAVSYRQLTAAFTRSPGKSQTLCGASRSSAGT
jgi:hypothetical protein